MATAVKELEVYVKALKIGNTSIVSALFINGIFFCHTLEDTYRPELPKTCPYTSKGQECKCPQKIKGHTAIPAGRYRAKFMMSPKFGRRLLRLIDVPHFIGILFHRGNTINDTDGCILAGDWKPGTNTLIVGSSTPRENELNQIFAAAADTIPVNSVEIWVTIDRDINSPLPFDANMKILYNATELITALKHKNFL